MLKRIITLILLLSTFQTFGFRAWNNANRPELFSFDYQRSFENLPLSGKLSKRPWSDSYWPTYQGGISNRWNKKWKVDHKHERYSYDVPNYENLSDSGIPIKYMSPAEKYDIYLGDPNFSLLKYERERTQIMKTVEKSPLYDKEFKIPTWEGLCHAWAPATMAYENIGAVTLTSPDGKEIPFGSSDIKALLTYHLQINPSPKTNFLGSRCNFDFEELRKKLEKEEITKEEFG